LRPAQQRFASQTPRLLDQPLLRSVRLLQIAFAILYRQGYRRDTVSNVRMAAQKGKQRFIAQIRARHQLRPPKSPPTKLTPHRVESHPPTRTTGARFAREREGASLSQALPCNAPAAPHCAPGAFVGLNTRLYNALGSVWLSLAEFG